MKKYKICKNCKWVRADARDASEKPIAFVCFYLPPVTLYVKNTFGMVTPFDRAVIKAGDGHYAVSVCPAVEPIHYCSKFEEETLNT